LGQLSVNEQDEDKHNETSSVGMNQTKNTPLSHAKVVHGSASDIEN
jgi:hypothetical protein